MIKTSVPLGDAVGKHISHFCSFTLGKENDKNHCAHFVSHLLGYEFANTCKNRTWDEKKKPEKGASIRVNEIFERSRDTGLWADRPPHLCACLIFVTRASNLTKAGDRWKMGSHETKHVGIFINGTFWHYSNGSDAVIAETEQSFMAKFNGAYRRSGDSVQYFYGALL